MVEVHALLVRAAVQRVDDVGAEAGGLFEHGLDHVAREALEAGKLRVAFEIEKIIEAEEVIAERRGRTAACPRVQHSTTFTARPPVEVSL